jgi:hypothetical protein
MTDRAQPGAIDSIIRNGELAQIFAQFSEGWIQKAASQPTPASVRRPEIDETALNAFELISTSGFDITIDAGEGFVGGWCARDTTTTITVPANTTSTIVLAWSLDAIFDPNTDPNRDLADEVRIDTAANVDPQYPRTELFDVATDGNGITGTTDRRRTGPTVIADVAEITDSLTDAAGVSHTGALADISDNVEQFSTAGQPGTAPIAQSDGSLVMESINDPVQITEEAVTFTESDVSVTTQKTELSNGSIGLAAQLEEGFFPDDFEDGVDSGWSGDTGSLSAVSSPVLSGSQSGQLSASNSQRIVNFNVLTSEDIVARVRANKLSSNPGDRVAIGLEDDSLGNIASVVFSDSGDVEIRLTSTKTISNIWTANTTFKVRVSYGSGNVEVFINGDLKHSDGPQTPSASTAEVGLIKAENSTFNSGINRNFYFDNSVTTPTSGNALIEFDSGTPNDIRSYDLATFQATPNGETVTVDVEDGSGNVLFSDINQNFDISTVDTSKNVTLRANISRANTSNNPTIDYLARRFTR